MRYPIQHIAEIIDADARIVTASEIEYLLTDSRKVVFPLQSLFFALSGNRRDGHYFITELYEKGIRNFVVKKGFNTEVFEQANFLCVADVLMALQMLAAYHRKQFSIPVIGITGSNGKTIVKEWLNQLLEQDYNIVRSPRSYNSQIGVPLSVWQMNGQHTLGIFEAGISAPGEMEHLEQIIKPTIGILTSIGNAHREGFSSREEKVKEKTKLFLDSEKIVYCKEHLADQVFDDSALIFSWSRKQEATVFIKQEFNTGTTTKLLVLYQEQQFEIQIPFTDKASVDNSITCICTLLMLGYSYQEIQQRVQLLQQVEMRLQLIKGINNCTIINDSYSNDLSSLRIALDYLYQQSSGHHQTVILSDILQSGLDENELYRRIALELKQRNISRFIGIGERVCHFRELFKSIPVTQFFSSTENFINQSAIHQFKDDFILLKGARVFGFEKINSFLEQKVHRTVLEINLTALSNNVKHFQGMLDPATKLMAMVKAFSYGSGSAEVARVLQFHKVDYLAVAYADEGVELRKADISLPIMVMNTDEAAFEALVEYNLEPEIYSMNMYQAFHLFLLHQGITHFPVHLKVNTGMNRLGFEPHEAGLISASLGQRNTMTVKTVFSHLVGSEAPELDYFTALQVSLFTGFCDELQKQLPYSFLKHISNSAAIARHPLLQFDMVRLGIGMYGIDNVDDQTISLETVAVLKSTIAQIREIKEGETVGYNRKGQLQRNSRIATVRIGYADGLSRKLGNGNGAMYLHNHLAPIVGNICMDMTMIDVTDIPGAREGDIVEVFGRHIPVEKLATTAGTITYEIMTGISQRVKRVYLEE
jgi:alanine racemase